jgi:hypothetical protein
MWTMFSHCTPFARLVEEQQRLRLGEAAQRTRASSSRRPRACRVLREPPAEDREALEQRRERGDAAVGRISVRLSRTLRSSNTGRSCGQ